MELILSLFSTSVTAIQDNAREIHKHPKSTTYSGNPVNEFDVNVAKVVDFAVDSRVDEEPEAKRELDKRSDC